MKKNRIRLSESQLHKVIKESVNKILREAVSVYQWNGPEIWNKYDIKWNEVDDQPEKYNGIWNLGFDVFDYTYCIGYVDVPQTFSSLEECLEFIENVSQSDIMNMIEDNVDSLEYDYDDLERISSISFDVKCKTQKGNFIVANTRPFAPTH